MRFTEHFAAHFRRLAAVLVTAVAVTACGGGSDRRGLGPDYAEGLWAGATSSGGTLDGVILDTGEYWLVFGSGGVARSLVYGTGYMDRRTFRSDNGIDYFFGQNAPFASTLAADVEPEFRLSGSLYLANRPEGFDLAYVPEYRFPANPNQIVGTWRGSASTLTTLGDFAITIVPGGDFAATLSGCDYAGRIVPNRGGRNVFDFTFASQPSCPFAFIAQGAMVATSGRLVFTGTTPDRRDAFYAVAQ